MLSAPIFPGKISLNKSVWSETGQNILINNKKCSKRFNTPLLKLNPGSTNLFSKMLSQSGVSYESKISFLWSSIDCDGQLSIIKPKGFQLLRLICLYGDSVVQALTCHSFSLDQKEKSKDIISQIYPCHFIEKWQQHPLSPQKTNAKKKIQISNIY